MTEPVRVATLDDLRRLRGRTDLDAVELVTAAFKYRRLLPLALRYALWATAPGGRIVIRDSSSDDPHGAPFEVPHNLVRRWVFQFLGRDAEPAGPPSDGALTLIRTTPLLPPGWSAGIVFSGRDQELPELKACLEGLAAQPELSPEAGGEIVVCGPPGAEPDLLRTIPGARYLDYADASGRFRIGAKKNHMAAALKGPRMILLHARIVLQPGALAGVPREFDILAPNTVFANGGEPTPYLSLSAADEPTPGRMPRRLTLNLRNVEGYDPMRLHQRGGVYVDGGAIIVAKPLYDQCSLNPTIGWNEGEDVEWCARALHCGYLSDLAADCHVVSSTSKLPRHPPLGPLHRPAQAAMRALRTAGAALRHMAR